MAVPISMALRIAQDSVHSLSGTTGLLLSVSDNDSEDGQISALGPWELF